MKHTMGRRSVTVCLAVFAVGLLASGCDWYGLGFDSSHSGDNSGDTTITPANVSTLVAKFSASDGTTGPLTAQAAVNGVLYASNSGKLEAYSANGTTGCSGSPVVCASQWSYAPGPVGNLSDRRRRRLRLDIEPIGGLRRGGSDELLWHPEGVPTAVVGVGDVRDTHRVQRDGVRNDLRHSRSFRRKRHHELRRKPKGLFAGLDQFQRILRDGDGVGRDRLRAELPWWHPRWNRGARRQRHKRVLGQSQGVHALVGRRNELSRHRRICRCLRRSPLRRYFLLSRSPPVQQ